MSSIIRDAIITEIENSDGEVQGTERLALKLNARRKDWMTVQVRVLEYEAEICVVRSPGGRGRMTVYRCPLSKCAHCLRLTCSRRATRAQLGYPRRARKPR